MYNIQEVINYITNFYLDNFNQFVYIFFQDSCNSDRLWWRTPILSAIASGVVLYYINYLNRENQKRQALYQHKYEFWLNFSKSFFLMKGPLLFLLKKENLQTGIVYGCGKEEVKNNLKKLITYWNEFYSEVEGNKETFLDAEGINVLILQTLISSVKNMIEKDDFIRESNNFSIIEAIQMEKLVTEAKLLFENNLKRLGNEELEKDYISALNDYSQKDKENSTPYLDAQMTYEEKIAVVDKISNDAYLKLINLNFDDISNKILKIINSDKDSSDIIFQVNVTQIWSWFWGNIIQKIFSVRNYGNHKVITILWIKLKLKR